MVHVHAGVGVPRPDEVIDEPLECVLLLALVGGPVGREPVLVDDAEQVFQTVITEERVALDVEEHVTGRRLGKQREPAALLRFEQLPSRLTRVALDELQPGLRGQSFTCGQPDRRRQLVRLAPAELTHRRDPGLAQAGGVRPGHERDEREIVFAAPLDLAPRLPPALGALLDRLRMRVVAGVGEVEQLRADQRCVGGAVGEGVPVLGAVAGDDGEVLGRDALQRRQPLGVGGHLKQRRHLHAPREFGVGYVVGPCPAPGPFAAQQEVGVPAPAPVEERGLVDDVGAGRHCFLGGRLGLAQRCGVTLGVRDLDDLTALVAQALQVALFVLEPPREQQLEHLVRALLRARQLPARHREIEVRQMAAGEVLREVGGADEERAVGLVHRTSLP